MDALRTVADAIDKFSEITGRAVAWLALLIVLVQFLVVGMRYVFGVPSIVLQESIIYMHAFIFMIAVGYTLLHEGHVRVDIFYAVASTRRKALIDLVGVVVLLLPVSAMIWYVSWTYVKQSWVTLETSAEVSGVPAVFLIKSAILVFATLTAVQGLSLAIRSVLTLMGIAPARGEPEPTAEQI